MLFQIHKTVSIWTILLLKDFVTIVWTLTLSTSMQKCFVLFFFSFPKVFFSFFFKQKKKKKITLSVLVWNWQMWTFKNNYKFPLKEISRAGLWGCFCSNYSVLNKEEQLLIKFPLLNNIHTYCSFWVPELRAFHKSLD